MSCHFRSRKIRTTKYGIETPSYIGPKLWNLVPNEDKTIEINCRFEGKNKNLGPRELPLQVM